MWTKENLGYGSKMDWQMMHREHFPHVRLFEDTMTISSMTIMTWSESVITQRHTCLQITRFTLCVLEEKEEQNEQQTESTISAMSLCKYFCKILEQVNANADQRSDLIPSLSLHDVWFTSFKRGDCDAVERSIWLDSRASMIIPGNSDVGSRHFIGDTVWTFYSSRK